MQAELVSDLSSVHGVGQILLVGKDEEKSVPELVLVQHALELLAGLDNTIAIVAVDDEDDTLGVLEVVSPQWADFVLASDVPHGELDVLVLDSLDVEACARLLSAMQLLIQPLAAPRVELYAPMVGMVVTISPSFSL